MCNVFDRFDSIYFNLRMPCSLWRRLDFPLKTAKQREDTLVSVEKTRFFHFLFCFVRNSSIGKTICPALNLVAESIKILLVQPEKSLLSKSA